MIIYPQVMLDLEPVPNLDPELDPNPDPKPDPDPYKQNLEPRSGSRSRSVSK